MRRARRQTTDLNCERTSARPSGCPDAPTSGCASSMPRRPAFSMMELMIAVVILGVGLLFTSSMFPIAWYKARDVADATLVPAAGNTGETYMNLLASVNDPSENISDFFPGDWFTFYPGQPWEPTIYPDTRVHHLNLGNYLSNGLSAVEPDWLSTSVNDLAPVGDNTWSLDDGIWSLNDPQLPGMVRNLQLHYPMLPGYVRLLPQMEEPRPDPSDPTVDPLAVRLWDEQFETRRYCWTAFYRFSEMPGPDGTSGVGVESMAVSPSEKARLTETSLERSRMLTMYYVTLRRPAGARYARQEGYVYDGGAPSWDPSKRPDQPRARGAQFNVALPVPWRIEATLLNPPPPPDVQAVAPTGIPSEIQVNDEVLAMMLQEGTYLLDDRTGQGYRITQRRPTGNQDRVVFTLDKEYIATDLYVARYVPFPGSEEMRRNWRREWAFRTCWPPCSSMLPDHIEDLPIVEDQPARRFYWVFPPPVESISNDGVPVFEGAPPVVGVEVRQMVITP